MIIQRCYDVEEPISFCFRFIKPDNDGYLIGYVNNVRRGSWDDIAELLSYGHSIILEEV